MSHRLYLDEAGRVGRMVPRVKQHRVVLRVVVGRAEICRGEVAGGWVFSEASRDQTVARYLLLDVSHRGDGAGWCLVARKIGEICREQQCGQDQRHWAAAAGVRP